MGKPPTKGQWKELLNKEIDKYWKNALVPDYTAYRLEKLHVGYSY
jgi:hypothetical protein